MRRTWLALDLVIVVVFVAIGRRTHHHGESFAGLCSTIWPFAVGLGLAWVLLLVRRRDGASAGDGAVIAVVTVAVGMVLRVLAGQGTAAAFVVVALVFLGGSMVGLRVLAISYARRRTLRRTSLERRA